MSRYPWTSSDVVKFVPKYQRVDSLRRDMAMTYKCVHIDSELGYSVYRGERGYDDLILVARLPGTGQREIAIRLEDPEQIMFIHYTDCFPDLIEDFLTACESPRYKSRLISIRHHDQSTIECFTEPTASLQVNNTVMPNCTPHPQNVAGPFYVENLCCLLCDLPNYVAPEMFRYTADRDHCFIHHQPETPAELQKMMEVLKNQDLVCIRCRSHDSQLLAQLREHDLQEICDEKTDKA